MIQTWKQYKEGAASMVNHIVDKLDRGILFFLCLDALCNTVSVAGANAGLAGALLFFLIRLCKKNDDIIERWKSVNCIVLTGAACYLCATYISGLFAIDHASSFSEIMHDFVFKPLALVMIVSVVRDRKSVILLAASLLAGVVINGLYAMFQLVDYSVLHEGKAGLAKRFSGKVHPVHFAGILGITVPALWALLVNHRDGKIKRLWAVMVMLLIFLAVNGTRGAWISILLACITVVFMSDIGRKKMYMLMLAMAFGIGGVVITVPQLQARVQSVADLSDISILTRLQMWRSAANMFLDYPVTGVGVGCYPKAYKEKYILPDIDAREKDNIGHAHSNFFQILADRGLIGIAGYFAFVISVFSCSYRDWKKHRMLAGLMVFAGWLSFFVQGFSEYSMGTFAPSKFMWTSLGIYISYRYICLMRESPSKTADY